MLVAEDNLINQEVTLGMLADLGCTSQCVADGQQALDALAHERFDLVLMDCQMPVMDGFEATRALRQREAGTAAHQVVIALTANASAEDREACRRAGMDDFLSKPFQRSELAGLLQHYAALAPASERVVDVTALVSAGAAVETSPVEPPRSRRRHAPRRPRPPRRSRPHHRASGGPPARR